MTDTSRFPQRLDWADVYIKLKDGRSGASVECLSKPCWCYEAAPSKANGWSRYVPLSELEAAQRRVSELEEMLVPHTGESWDSDRPPVLERVVDLFVALGKLGTQEETEPTRRTLRTLLYNRETLAARVAELEAGVRRAYGLVPGDAVLEELLGRLLAKKEADGD